MRIFFSRPTAGTDSYSLPHHIRTLCESGIPTENVPAILGNLRKRYGRKGFTLNEVRSDGKSTVYAVLTQGRLRFPVVEDI